MSKDSNIPKNYFNELPGKVWGKIDQLEDRVEENAPRFYELSQSNPYHLPEGYFESFRSKLKLQPKGRVISMNVIRPYLVAASVLAVAVLSWVMLPNNAGDEIVEDGLLYADVYEYYSEDIDLSDQDLFLDFEEEDFEESSLVSEELTEEEIYLYEEAILQEMTDQELLGIL